MCDLIIVPCDACLTEGRIYVAAGYDRETGAPQERDDGPCPYCEGTGGEIIRGEPLTVDDMEILDHLAREAHPITRIAREEGRE